MSHPINAIPGLHSKNSLEKSIDWAKAHQQWVAVAGFAVLLIAFGVPYYLSSRAQDEKKAQDELSLGQYYLQSRIDPQNGPFKSAVERDQHALQAFQEILDKYSGTPASKLAKFYTAKCQFNLGQYQQAYGSFETAAEALKDTPLGDESFFGKVLCLAAQNQVPQAITLSETFLKSYPDSFIGPQVRLNLSDLYLKNKEQAKALEQLNWVAQKAQDSNWGKEAQRRLKALKS
ncbi:MAG TPA: tetratricopeptide repeat protein [bacterium]|nr:tetratricopeptide repeat protein [bacterium]